MEGRCQTVVIPRFFHWRSCRRVGISADDARSSSVSDIFSQTEPDRAGSVRRVIAVDTRQSDAAGFMRSARAFFLEFCRYAKGDGIVAGLLVAGGAVLEGVGLVLLVPVLGIVMDGAGGRDWIAAQAVRIFEYWGIDGRGERLALLLACF